ncbi:MAG TPA: glycosyltransferase family 4 protein [Desulfobacterales bacterium]|nr:glycosyltransferase family 4 protein [Desulfobacterales bacterium]HIP38570.1 glycosyltransferase family 4 protein [Desulfocapsa sulfexigens]
MENLRDKTLLIVSQNYASFVKDQVECLASFYKHIYVLAVTRPIAEISNFLPLHSLKPFRKKVKINVEGLPENVTVFPTPLTYLPGKSSYKKVGKLHLKVVERLIEKHDLQFDIVHCHFTYSSGYVGEQLKKEFHIPLIITAHGFDVYDLPFRDSFWQDRVANTLESADRIITVSKKNITCIRKIGVQIPVDLIPNGYQKQNFFPMDKKSSRETLQLLEQSKIIVSVGNLVAIKGHRYLIEAMAQLVKLQDNLRCYIIGSGGLRKKLERQIDDNGLGGNVFLIGSIKHTEIAPWLSAADMFVLPSLNEGNPTVLFESLACACPFIGADVGGVSEIVIDEKLGYLFQPGNVKDMADVIGKALSIKWDRSYIADHSQRYSWECIAKEIVKTHSTAFDSYLLQEGK